MKTLILLLLLLFVTSCAITTETDVKCWRHRICVGDTYVYTKTPKHGGGHYVTQVQVITFRGNSCLIRHANGRESWVSVKYFESYISPIHVKHQPSNKEKKDNSKWR